MASSKISLPIWMLFILILLSFSYTYHTRKPQAPAPHMSIQTSWMMGQFLRQAIHNQQPELALHYGQELAKTLETPRQKKEAAKLIQQIRAWAIDPYQEKRQALVESLVLLGLKVPPQKMKNLQSLWHLPSFIQVRNTLNQPVEEMPHPGLLTFSWSMQNAIASHDRTTYRQSLNMLLRITPPHAKAYPILQTLRAHPYPSRDSIDLKLLEAALEPKPQILVLSPKMFIGMA